MGSDVEETTPETRTQPLAVIESGRLALRDVVYIIMIVGSVFLAYGSLSTKVTALETETATSNDQIREQLTRQEDRLLTRIDRLEDRINAITTVPTPANTNP